MRSCAILPTAGVDRRRAFEWAIEHRGRVSRDRRAWVGASARRLELRVTVRAGAARDVGGGNDGRSRRPWPTTATRRSSARPDSRRGRARRPDGVVRARVCRARASTSRTFCLARAYASTMPAIRTRALRRVAEPVLLSAFNEHVGALTARRRGRPRAGDQGTPTERSHGEPPSRVERRACRQLLSRTTRSRTSDRIGSRTGLTCLAAYDACFTFARHLIPDYERAGVARRSLSAVRSRSRAALRRPRDQDAAAIRRRVRRESR